MAMSSRMMLVLLAFAVAAVDARLMHDAAARQLLQNQRCPAGCDVAGSGCVADATSGGYRCTKCLGKLVVNDADGTCGCPAGRYADVDNDCNDCPKGSWCAGGTYAAVGSPNMTDCGASLTTIGKRATSIKSCVNVAGTSYSVDASGNPSATTCPVDTYGPGLRKQRTCVPCPPGYTTNTLTGQSRSTACVVPEGFYLKGPGQVAPCPKGEYKAGFATVASCSKCATGVTTVSQASTSEAACTTVLPGYYPSSLVGGIVKATERCPQKFYCVGGAPTAAFDPASPAVLTGTTVAACADGTWTQAIGASAASQCMTPPGYKTANSATTPCADGEYRAEWKVASQAATCSSCGEGIQSDATDQITEYAITADATPSAVAVRASAAACYIKAGQGMYYSAASGTYKGVNCDTNNYGIANKTYGLAAFPCRDCPSGMQTSTSLANSAAYWSTDGATPVRQGFTSPMACVTRAGYGYNGRVANKCAAGSYNAAGNYGTCTQCAPGLSTADDAALQVAASDCMVAKGYGLQDGVVQACPVGTYNDALRPNATAACTACPTGLTTSQAGGVSSTDCNVCSAGYGGANCGSQCGGASATFAPAGQPINTACQTCPTMSTGFSFDYNATNRAFTPASVARTGADNAGDCLAEFAQIVDSAWYLGGSAALNNVTASTFDDCVADCKADATCQYVTYDYDAATCQKKVVAAGGTTLVAYKAVVAGDSTAASLKQKQAVRAKGLASGSYTFWLDSAAASVSATQTPAAGVTTVQGCLDACDASAGCAAVVMTGMASASSAPASCSLVTGDARVAQFKRSVTRAVPARLTVAAAF